MIHVFPHQSVAEKRPRIHQNTNEIYHNFISAPMVVPAVYNPSNGTYSFISNIPGPGGVPLRTDFADSSEDGSNSEVGLACLHEIYIQQSQSMLCFLLNTNIDSSSQQLHVSQM